MHTTENLNKLDYKLLMEEHSIEKGLSHFDLRPFGDNTITNLLKFINLELKYENNENHFAFKSAIK